MSDQDTSSHKDTAPADDDEEFDRRIRNMSSLPRIPKLQQAGHAQSDESDGGVATHKSVLERAGGSSDSPLKARSEWPKSKTNSGSSETRPRKRSPLLGKYSIEDKDVKRSLNASRQSLSKGQRETVGGTQDMQRGVESFSAALNGNRVYKSSSSGSLGKTARPGSVDSRSKPSSKEQLKETARDSNKKEHHRDVDEISSSKRDKQPNNSSDLRRRNRGDESKDSKRGSVRSSRDKSRDSKNSSSLDGSQSKRPADTGLHKPSGHDRETTDGLSVTKSRLDTTMSSPARVVSRSCDLRYSPASSDLFDIDKAEEYNRQQFDAEWQSVMNSFADDSASPFLPAVRPTFGVVPAETAASTKSELFDTADGAQHCSVEQPISEGQHVASVDSHVADSTAELTDAVKVPLLPLPPLVDSIDEMDSSCDVTETDTQTEVIDMEVSSLSSDSDGADSDGEAAAGLDSGAEAAAVGNQDSAVAATDASDKGKAGARKTVTFSCPEGVASGGKGKVREKRPRKERIPCGEMPKEELQERIVHEVKELLRPLYLKRKISKDEYKNVLRKAVPKISRTRRKELSVERIHKCANSVIKSIRRQHRRVNPSPPSDEPEGGHGEPPPPPPPPLPTDPWYGAGGFSSFISSTQPPLPPAAGVPYDVTAAGVPYDVTAAGVPYDVTFCGNMDMNAAYAGMSAFAGAAPYGVTFTGNVDAAAAYAGLSVAPAAAAPYDVTYAGTVNAAAVYAGMSVAPAAAAPYDVTFTGNVDSNAAYTGIPLPPATAVNYDVTFGGNVDVSATYAGMGAYSTGLPVQRTLAPSMVPPPPAPVQAGNGPFVGLQNSFMLNSFTVGGSTDQARSVAATRM